VLSGHAAMLPSMATYDEAMAIGASRYADVLETLREEGLPAGFTQTGGMCAAIEVHLEGGHTLLVTDAEDCLAWDRDSHRGWGVGLYRPASEYDDGPLRFEEDEDGSLSALLPLVRRVLLAPLT